MRFGSLFSGIGGIDLGLERAGMSCAWQVEIDPYCTRVLQKHWPNVKRYSDVRELRGEELDPVDLIAGGFPCQPLSVAGLGRGADDPRWLWPYFRELIGVVRPRYVLVENVPGLLSRNGGREMGQVLGDLAALRYDAEWQVISAADVGAPHLRERVWLLAYPNGQRREELHVLPVAGDERQRDWKDHAVEDALCDPSRGRRGRKARRRAGQESQDRHGWAIEPNVCRVAHGIPDRVDRLRGLGNAVVPQVVELVGRAIMQAEA